MSDKRKPARPSQGGFDQPRTMEWWPLFPVGGRPEVYSVKEKPQTKRGDCLFRVRGTMEP